jgi:hypothetical protein
VVEILWLFSPDLPCQNLMTMTVVLDGSATADVIRGQMITGDKIILCDSRVENCSNNVEPAANLVVIVRQPNRRTHPAVGTIQSQACSHHRDVEV